MKKQILKYFAGIILLIGFGACSTDTPPPETTSQAMISTGNPAIDDITRQIMQTPDDPALYAARAKKFYEYEGYDNAIYDMRDAMKIDSNNIEYHHLLADIYLDYSRSRLALQTMERAVALAPQRIPTLLKLSEFQYILKQYDASMSTLAKVLAIDPQNAEAFFMRGLNYIDQGNKKGAMDNLQTAVDNDADHVDAWVTLGKIYEDDNNPLAENYYENAIQAAPNSIEPLHNKALYLHKNDKLDEAVELYKKINQLDPQYADAYYNLGIIYMEKDSVTKAYDHFNITINTDPTFVMGYYYRGLAAEALGNLQAAKGDFEQVLNFAPEYEKAQEGLARVNKLLE